MPFISLFYPAADAAEHFVAGQHLEIAGPVFRTYAEAVSELEQEASDVAEQGLPVEAYVLEVRPLRGGGGYSIVEAFEVSFGGMRGGARARNPREPKTVEMPELRGFKFGPDRELTLDEAAAVYGDFMAHNIPEGVPAGKVRRAFGAAATPPSVERHRKEAAAIREKAAGKVASSLTHAVETHGVDGAKEIVEQKLAAVSEALDARQITAQQAAPIIALETKKLQILDLLQRFCPPVGEEGAQAIYEVVRATLGGDEAAAEAGRVILEDVASRFTSAKVEVDDSAMPAPRKTRAKAAGKAAAAEAAVPDATVFSDPTAFVKAYGSRIRGSEKLAKALVSNAIGLTPFPSGYPINELREAASDVYRLLAEAGMVAAAPPVAPPGYHEIQALLNSPEVLPMPVEEEPLPVAQFDDPALQAVFGGLPVPPLPEQPDDYIMREYSYETGLPVYGMRFGGKLPPDRTPDLAQAIAVAERAGVQTHTYYDTALQSGGADFRPIEEAWERDAEERRFATQIVEMPVPEPPPAPVAALPQNEATRWREIGRREVPGIRSADAEDVGRSWEQVQRGILTQADFDAFVERLRFEGRVQSAPVRSTGPRELSIAIDGIRGVEVPPALLPSSAAYLKNEIAFGQLNRDEPPAVFRRSFTERDRGNRNAWKIVPVGKNFANIEEWASQYYTPAMPEPPPAPVAAPALSAEEQLAAKIAAGNEAGLARFHAMLNG